MDFTRLLNRVKNILISPKTEWEVIKTEDASIQSLFVNYALILAAIPALASLLSGLLFKGMFASVPIVMGYFLSLAGIFLVAFIIDLLAPNFGSEKNLIASLKVVIYASTASWIAGIFIIIPFLSLFTSLAGAIYTLYLMYLGLGQVKDVPNEKLPLFFAIVVVLSIIVNIIIGATVAMMGLSALVGIAH